MNNISYLVLALIFSLILEYIISFFFTFKIRETARSNYALAALWGGLSTLLFTFTILLNAFIPTILGTSQSIQITYIVVSSVVVTIGNVLGTMSIPVVLAWFDNKKVVKDLVVNKGYSIQSAKSFVKESSKDKRNSIKEKHNIDKETSAYLKRDFKKVKLNEVSKK